MYANLYLTLSGKTANLQVVVDGELKKTQSWEIENRAEAIWLVVAYVHDVMTQARKVRNDEHYTFPWKLHLNDEALFKGYYERMDVSDKARDLLAACRMYAKTYHMQVVFVRRIPVFQWRIENQVTAPLSTFAAQPA